MRWNWYFSGCTLLSSSWFFFLTLKLKVVCLFLLANSHIASAQLSSVTCWMLMVDRENYSQQIKKFSHEITKIHQSNQHQKSNLLTSVHRTALRSSSKTTQNLNKTSSLSFFPSHTEIFVVSGSSTFFINQQQKADFFHLRLFLFLLFHTVSRELKRKSRKFCCKIIFLSRPETDTLRRHRCVSWGKLKLFDSH